MYCIVIFIFPMQQTMLDKGLQIPLWATMLGAEFVINNQKNSWKYIVINVFLYICNQLWKCIAFK